MKYLLWKNLKINVIKSFNLTSAMKNWFNLFQLMNYIRRSILNFFVNWNLILIRINFKSKLMIILGVNFVKSFHNVNNKNKIKMKNNNILN